MAEKQLTDSQANSLSGTLDDATGVRVPTRDTVPAYTATYRMLGRMLDLMALAASLRVYEVDGNADAVGVRAGRCTIDGTVYSYDGEDPAVDDLTDNDTTYVWAQDDGGGELEIDSAVDGTGWPATAHIKLAEVTLADGEITGVVDRRPEVMLSNAAALTEATTTTPGTVTQAAAVDDIADTSTADAEDVGDKVNELLSSLRSAGILAIS